MSWRGNESRRRTVPWAVATVLAASACFALALPVRSAPGTPSTALGGSAVVEAPPPPSDPGPFAPSRLRVRGAHLTASDLADVDRCAPCHEDLVAQWRASAHAQSSFDNPFYRFSVETFREDAGLRESRFCGGCHDPVLLLSGGLDAAVRPTDALARAGVPCLVCHSARQAATDGNASLELDLSPVPLPEGDDASLAAHVARLATPTLQSPALCGACHRAFLGPEIGLPHHLPGTDDLGPWAASPYAGSLAARVSDDAVPRARCTSCHMPAERAPTDAAAYRGRVRSHRFPGAHEALAVAPGQAAAVARMLEGAATVHVPVLWTGDGVATSADRARIAPGDTLRFDAVVRNARAGHAFPGGTRDLQDTWLEVTVRDARGRVWLEAGTAHEHAPGGDPSAHRLGAWMVASDGRLETLHRVDRFRVKAADTTVEALGVRAVRYEGRVPVEARPPLTIDVRLRHRRHPDDFRAAACAEARSARGRAYVRGRAAAVDPCRPLPITEIARAEVVVGDPADPPSAGALAALALALAEGLGDHVDEARPVLALAERAVTADDATVRAHIAEIGARVEARQGRVAEAFAAARRAQAWLGRDHPALDRIRGEALARVWRFRDAEPWLAAVADAAPRDTSAWRSLARVRGSSGDDRAALAAAARGLTGQPRDGGLLRTVALALDALGDPAASRARAAWLAYRGPDDADALGRACADADPRCARARDPVPTFTLRPRDAAPSAAPVEAPHRRPQPAHAHEQDGRRGQKQVDG